MNFKFLLPLLLVMCVSLVPTRGQAQEHALAITNVTIIDGTGAAPRPGMTVLLVGDRIRTIRRKLRIPAGAEVVDATGKYLIPGLRDMHVHVGSYEDGKVLFRRLVAFGITGVRDMASPPDDIIRLREGIREGTLFGPRITLAGPILQGPLPFQPPPMVRIVVNSEDARRAVDELSRKGVDFIKVGDTLDRDEYLAVAGQARKKGLPFAGHLPVSVGAAEASHAGQRSIEHFGSVRFHGLLIACSDDEVALHRTAQHALDTARMGGPSPDATLMRATFINSLLNGYNAGKARRLFAEFPKNRTWQVPTLVAIKDVWNRQRAELTPADSAAADRLWHKYSEVIRSMRAAGVRLMAGTDVPIGDMVSPLHDELGLLVEAGLSPMEALQTATRNPAEYLGLLRNEGTVTAGKVADLVLLDADPLTDITNIRRINSVVLRGRLIRNTELQQLR